MVAEGLRIFAILFEGVLIDHLDLLPGGSVYDWLTIIFDDGVAIAHDADVELIGKKVVPGVFALVEACFSGELLVGRAQGSQRKGALDEGREFGIRFPAVDDMRFSIAACAKDDGLGAFETARGRSADGLVLGDVVLETAFYIAGEVLQVAGVHPVDGGFEATAIETLGDSLVEGVDDIAAPTQIGFVVLGVVDLAGEAGEFPHKNAGFIYCLMGRTSEVGDHGEEACAADGGGTGCGFVFEDLGEGEVVGLAPAADFGFLLWDGEILRVSAGIAQVGGDGRAGWEGVICHQGLRDHLGTIYLYLANR